MPDLLEQADHPSSSFAEELLTAADAGASTAERKPTAASPSESEDVDLLLGGPGSLTSKRYLSSRLGGRRSPHGPPPRSPNVLRVSGGVSSPSAPVPRLNLPLTSPNARRSSAVVSSIPPAPPPGTMSPWELADLMRARQSLGSPRSSLSTPTMRFGGGGNTNSHHLLPSRGGEKTDGQGGQQQRQQSPGGGGTSPRAGRYGAWYVPPSDWKPMFGGSPDAMAELGRRLGVVSSVDVDVEAQATLAERMDLAQELLQDSYSVSAFREYARENHLREPQSLKPSTPPGKSARTRASLTERLSQLTARSGGSNPWAAGETLVDMTALLRPTDGGAKLTAAAETSDRDGQRAGPSRGCNDRPVVTPRAPDPILDLVRLGISRGSERVGFSPDFSKRSAAGASRGGSDAPSGGAAAAASVDPAAAGGGGTPLPPPSRGSERPGTTDAGAAVARGESPLRVPYVPQMISSQLVSAENDDEGRDDGASTARATTTARGAAPMRLFAEEEGGDAEGGLSREFVAYISSMTSMQNLLLSHQAFMKNHPMHVSWWQVTARQRAEEAQRRGLTRDLGAARDEAKEAAAAVAAAVAAAAAAGGGGGVSTAFGRRGRRRRGSTKFLRRAPSPLRVPPLPPPAAKVKRTVVTTSLGLQGDQPDQGDTGVIDGDNSSRVSQLMVGGGGGGGGGAGGAGGGTSTVANAKEVVKESTHPPAYEQTAVEEPLTIQVLKDYAALPTRCLMELPHRNACAATSLPAPSASTAPASHPTPHTARHSSHADAVAPVPPAAAAAAAAANSATRSNGTSPQRSHPPPTVSVANPSHPLSGSHVAYPTAFAATATSSTATGARSDKLSNSKGDSHHQPAVELNGRGVTTQEHEAVTALEGERPLTPESAAAAGLTWLLAAHKHLDQKLSSSSRRHAAPPAAASAASLSPSGKASPRSAPPALGLPLRALPQEVTIAASSSLANIHTSQSADAAASSASTAMASAAKSLPAMASRVPPLPLGTCGGHTNGSASMRRSLPLFPSAHGNGGGSGGAAAAAAAAGCGGGGRGHHTLPAVFAHSPRSRAPQQTQAQLRPLDTSAAGPHAAVPRAVGRHSSAESIGAAVGWAHAMKGSNATDLTAATASHNAPIGGRAAAQGGLFVDDELAGGGGGASDVCWRRRGSLPRVGASLTSLSQYRLQEVGSFAG